MITGQGSQEVTWQGMMECMELLTGVATHIASLLISSPGRAGQGGAAVGRFLHSYIVVITVELALGESW